MQIPILNGIYTDASADFRTSYPVNLVPVPKEQGISQGYLKTAAGLVQFATGSGIDRGGVRWNDVLYRVSGTDFIKVASDGAVTVIGSISGTGRCSFSYSFDRLAISNGQSLYYYDGDALSKVTDVDAGTVKDHIWVDGYFMLTDGTYLIVTELTDPTQINPLKYGSSEADPDQIIGLARPVDEVYAVNRYTTEVFGNVGGSYFPFQRVDGATINKGAIGKDAICNFADTVAFVGSGKNEELSVYLVGSGSATSIATREIEALLGNLSESQYGTVVLEARKFKKHEHLYLHTPSAVAVYDLAASKTVGEPVWFFLATGAGMEAYRAINFVYVYNRWVCGDKLDGRIGAESDKTAQQYGEGTGWQFDTQLVYNASRGGIVHELELVSLTGRAPTIPAADAPVCWHSWTQDGLVWSQERPMSIGASGRTDKRIVWHQLGMFRNWRGLRFRGVSDGPIAFARLEAQMEALNG